PLTTDGAGSLFGPSARASADREVDAELEVHGHRAAAERRRLEPPLLHGVRRRLVEAEAQPLHQPHVGDVAGAVDGGLHDHHALAVADARRLGVARRDAEEDLGPGHPRVERLRDLAVARTGAGRTITHGGAAARVRAA